MTMTPSEVCINTARYDDQVKTDIAIHRLYRSDADIGLAFKLAGNCDRTVNM